MRWAWGRHVGGASPLCSSPCSRSDPDLFCLPLTCLPLAHPPQAVPEPVKPVPTSGPLLVLCLLPSILSPPAFCVARAVTCFRSWRKSCPRSLSTPGIFSLFLFQFSSSPFSLPDSFVGVPTDGPWGLDHGLLYPLLHPRHIVQG